MNVRIAKWVVALLLSAVLHAGAAIWFAGDQDVVQIAGGATAEIAVLGNAFQDSMAAGQTSDAAEPVETETEAVEPVKVQAVDAVQIADAAKPVVNPPETAIQQQPIGPTEQAETAEPVEPVQPARETPNEAMTPQAVEPVEAIENGIAIAALQPQDVVPEAQEMVAPAQTEAVQPVEEPELPQTPDIAPRPTPRPEQVANAEPPRKTEPKSNEKAEKKPRRKKQWRAGAGGQNNANTRKGTADGSKDARQTQSGGAGKSRESGNAAVSNYPGKIVSKLRRSLRYPSEAKRKRIRGEVHVRFTVSRSGGVGSVGIAHSSGSPVLDKAALDTVRRAAPFPAIPAEAGRSSWSFTVPLAFRR